MFSFLSLKKKVSLRDSGLLNGALDLHCHLLPGVDDGSPDVEHTLDMLTYLEGLGYEEVWFTPHTMEEVYNTKESLEAAFQAFLPHYTGKLKLHISSEYMLDKSFEKHLANDDLLPIGPKQDYLLVETSYMYGPENLDDLLLTIFKKGFIPVIAHPERYEYMQQEDYDRLKEKGYKFQLNLNSLSGYYGLRAHKHAEKLLAQGLYDFVGTDLHHLKYYTEALRSIRLKKEQVEALRKLFENNKIFKG